MPEGNAQRLEVVVLDKADAGGGLSAGGRGAAFDRKADVDVSLGQREWEGRGSRLRAGEGLEMLQQLTEESVGSKPGSTLSVRLKL